MKSAFAIAILLVLITCSAGLGTYYSRPTVLLETNFGDITIELFPDAAPISVENFLGYVNSGFYGDSIFHRVAKDPAVIQDGQGDPCSLGDPITNESYNGLSNIRGTIGL